MAHSYKSISTDRQGFVDRPNSSQLLMVLQRNYAPTASVFNWKFSCVCDRSQATGFSPGPQ